MIKKYFLEKFFKNLSPEIKLSIKLFSLLLISTIVVHLTSWVLDWKIGETFWFYHSKTVTYSELLSPTKDLGYFEHFQYILLIWCGILSLFWSINNQKWSGISISLIYFYLFIDDSIGIHDRVIDSNNFLKNFSENNSFYLKDISEAYYWFLVFIVCLLIFLPGLLSKSKTTRNFIKTNIFLFMAMAIFGVFIDLIHSNLNKVILFESAQLASFVGIFLNLIEECGEISIVCFSCIWLFSKNFSSTNVKKNNN